MNSTKKMVTISYDELESLKQQLMASAMFLHERQGGDAAEEVEKQTKNKIGESELFKVRAMLIALIIVGTVISFIFGAGENSILFGMAAFTAGLMSLFLKKILTEQAEKKAENEKI